MRGLDAASAHLAHSTQHAARHTDRGGRLGPAHMHGRGWTHALTDGRQPRPGSAGRTHDGCAPSMCGGPCRAGGHSGAREGQYECSRAPSAARLTPCRRCAGPSTSGTESIPVAAQGTQAPSRRASGSPLCTRPRERKSERAKERKKEARTTNTVALRGAQCLATGRGDIRPCSRT